MIGKRGLAALLLVLGLELGGVAFLAGQGMEWRQDAVQVNEAVQSVQAGWGELESHENCTDLDYVVVDLDGRVLFRTKMGLSESINQAVIHRDTVLDLWAGGVAVGKILVYNDSGQAFGLWRKRAAAVLAAAILLQGAACVGYLAYLELVVVKPFHKLEGFAERVAGGDLDIPLEMDRQNLFGAFTESFDLMRAELKKAREAEAKANASKKELVAKLSHDIKTPVASIKAAAEVGEALADTERGRENYGQIIQKADQINGLITNLFTATLEELQQLTVAPEDMGSQELEYILGNADYRRRAVIPAVPECLLYADRLRLQQVFDNIFANSYKYADTEIEVGVRREGDCLAVSVEDYGGGVKEGELPLLKEKFKRGENAEKIEGVGLGLFIADYFMEGMQGKLSVQNGKDGLRVTVMIALSGTIAFHEGMMQDGGGLAIDLREI